MINSASSILEQSLETLDIFYVNNLLKPNMTPADILTTFLHEMKIKPAEIERSAGLGNGTIGKAMKNNSFLTLDSIEKIVAAYPRVNRSFLKEGKLPVLTDNNGFYAIVDKNKFLVEKAIKNEALLETILELLAEMSLSGKEGLVIQRINELKKAAEDKTELILRKL